MEAALDIVVDLGRTLAQVCPFFRVVEKAMLVGAFGGPDHARGCSTWVQAGMRSVSFIQPLRLGLSSLGNAKHLHGIRETSCARRSWSLNIRASVNFALVFPMPLKDHLFQLPAVTCLFQLAC